MIDADPQKSAIAEIDTTGGCLIVINCADEVTEPQELVVVSVIEYVPGVIKLNDGFAEDGDPVA